MWALAPLCPGSTTSIPYGSITIYINSSCVPAPRNNEMFVVVRRVGQRSNSSNKQIAFRQRGEVKAKEEVIYNLLNLTMMYYHIRSNLITHYCNLIKMLYAL
jgi:hypothetical protein